MIVTMDDFHNFGRKFKCTDCGLEDFISDLDMVRATAIEFKHECKPLLKENK